jgi:hypothetical protein
MSLAGHSFTRPRAELSAWGTKSTRYPASCSAAPVVSPTAAMRVLSGTFVPWLVSTSTVVALVTISQSN